MSLSDEQIIRCMPFAHLMSLLFCAESCQSIGEVRIELLCKKTFFDIETKTIAKWIFYYFEIYNN
jgi:hypothetical protein